MSEDKNLFKVTYINLDSRTDRRKQFEKSMTSAGFDLEKINRFEAIKDNFGEIGCVKSHFLALSEMICREPAEYFIILEDDFDISVSREQITKLLSLLKLYNVNFDLLDLFPHLAKIFPIFKLKFDGGELQVFRTMFARSTSGYIVHRNKAIKIVNHYMTSIEALERNRGFLRNQKTRLQMQRYAADGINVLQHSQATSLHIAFNFEFGVNSDSKSDIIEYEGRHFNSAEVIFGYGKKCPI